MDSLKLTVPYSKEVEQDLKIVPNIMALAASNLNDLLALDLGIITQEEYDEKWPKYEPTEEDEVYYCNCKYCEGHDGLD